MDKDGWFILGGIVTTLAFCVGIGVLIGWFSGPDRIDGTIAAARSDASGKITEKLIDLIDKDAMNESLRFLTIDTHISGSNHQYVVAQKIKDEFESYGLDKSVIYTYNVLLSTPSEEESVIQKLVEDPSQSDGYRVVFQTKRTEPLLDEDSQGKYITPAFSAYTASGTVEGELVYANYASIDDFYHLVTKQEINITDKIVIARYGKLYEGDKATLAARFGAKGLILYSDPADYNVESEPMYPGGIYLPTNAILRGTLLKQIGDPATPYFPAVAGAYRHSNGQQLSLAEIPVHPISSPDAEPLLNHLGGAIVGTDWTGNIPGVIYRYGPGFVPPEQNRIVRMIIQNKNVFLDTWDVMGTIVGDVEPDRFVVIGSHCDAWAFGAVDPSTGTSVLLEIARAFAKLKVDGWRPRRSIIFASWGAGEFGHIGANEWVEEHSLMLQSSTVAYLNIDSAVAGTFVPKFSSTPNLYNIIREAAKQVPDPNPEDVEETVSTVYDRWLLRSELINDKPIIGDLATGSFTPFLQISGVSALDFAFVSNEASQTPELFPLRHSIYDTFDLFHRFYDPSKVYLQASARLLAEIARVLSDSKVIPLKCNDYANRIHDSYRELRFSEAGLNMISEGGLTFDYMEVAIANLMEKTEAMDNYIETELNQADIIAVRSVNDMLMNFERSFLNPNGLPGRPALRHVIFAPSSKNQNKCDVFPGIMDTLFDIDNNSDPNKWEYVAQQLAATTHAINRAAQTIDINWAN